MENLRTIRVMGRGDVTLRPDLTRLTITLQGTEVEYAAALERSAKEAGALKDALAAVGFDREALKTLAFAVDAKYEGYQDEKGQWLQRLLWY